MTRTGLFIALAIGLAVGVVFAIYPDFDLALSRPMYDNFNPKFAPNGTIQGLRKASEYVDDLIAASAIIAVLVKFFIPRARMLVPGRAALFMIASILIGPLFLTNVVLKDHWGRYRPIAVKEFNGKYDFTPWWDPRGKCSHNCSFVAGEPSEAFWMLAPASLAPAPWRPLAYAVAIAFGIANGFLRMAVGGHFFTDVVFAGVFTFVIIWLTYGFIYRWPRTRMSDDAIADAIAWPMSRFYGAIGGRRKRPAD